MYEITKEQWEKIPNDYKGYDIWDKSTKTVFEGAIPGNNGKGGCTLLFEGKHFIIV